MSDLSSYEGIVESWGYKVVDWKTCGSYQGDHLVLLQNGRMWAYLVIGYGSCSGCDHLEAIAPGCWHRYRNEECDCDWTPVEQYSESLKESIKWGSPADLLEEFTTDMERQWWYHDREMKSAIEGWLIELVGYQDVL